MGYSMKKCSECCSDMPDEAEVCQACGRRIVGKPCPECALARSTDFPEIPEARSYLDLRSLRNRGTFIHGHLIAAARQLQPGERTRRGSFGNGTIAVESRAVARTFETARNGFYDASQMCADQRHGIDATFVSRDADVSRRRHVGFKGCEIFGNRCPKFFRGTGKYGRFWKPEWGADPVLIEAFEISEYAGQASDGVLDQLFPGRLPR